MMQTNDSAPENPTADPSRPPSSQSRQAALISTIEGEMVPRLLMLCRTASAERDRASNRGCETDASDVEELARLLVAHGPDIAWAFVEAVRQRGMSYERICVQILAPAARRLAEQWEHRDLGKSELALGLVGLRTVLFEIGNAAKHDRHAPPD
jgi:hypothetical protein